MAMRLHSVTFANFKSFLGEVEIPIGRITYLVGPNGAGKSNILEGIQKISSMILDNEHVARPDDFFNDDDVNGMKLGATFELSDEEQLSFFKYWTQSKKSTQADLGLNAPFRFVKYVVMLDLSAESREEIYMSTGSGKFEQFACSRRVGKQFVLDSRDREGPRIENTLLPPMDSKIYNSQISIGDLFSRVDTLLLTKITTMFESMKTIGTDRGIPPAVAIHESGEISPTGQNLANELNDLPRAEQGEFDRYLAYVTHGDPSGVEPRAVGPDLVLDVREEGLSRQASHADLGSGQLQTLILGWQMFRQEGSILIVKEPELHLHAERQRRMLRLLRDKCKKDDIQFIIETHSPVFLGAGPGERTVLVTKSNSRSQAEAIGPDNVGLLRREIGITHADAPYADNVVLAEGSSDLAVLAPLLRFPSSERPFSTGVFSMHGARNTNSLKMLVRYLNTDSSRRIFAVLDEGPRSERQIKNLEDAGLPSSSLYLVRGDGVDGLGDDLIVKAAREMASESGGDLQMTAQDLRKSRREGKAVAATLKEYWDEEQCRAFDEAGLAGRIIGLLGGAIPQSIEEALRAAAAHFEGVDADGGGDAGHGGAAGGRP